MNKLLQPKKTYLDKVAKESTTLKTALKDQLLVLDLNGTLVSRNRNNKSMYARPYCQEFFDYIFDNFKVMLWSSAQPHSVKFMCRVFGDKKEKLDNIWDRTTLGLSQHNYNRKVITTKDLDKVWAHYSFKYNATNTILLDDSPEKTVLQPYNAIHPTEFDHSSSSFVSGGDSELLHVMDYLKKIQFQSNVSWYIKNNPYKPITDSEKNIFKLGYFRYLDSYTAPALMVDLKPVKEDDLVDAISNIKIK